MSLPRGLHLHLDTPAGIAGDMTLGALFDLGVPEAAVRDVLARLPVGGYQLSVTKGLRGGLAGTDVKVVVERPVAGGAHEHEHEHEHHDDHGHEGGHAVGGKHARFHAAGHAHRHWREIRAMLAGLPDDVRVLATSMFERIAVAEAKLHGVSVDDVAFHEVGAIDSIVDLVGTAAAVAHLAPARVTVTPLPLGHGEVQASHGRLPVPAPATLEILRAAAAPSHDGGAAFELTTPTGAAIAVTLAASWGAAPAGTVVAVGYGAGDAELPDRPNLLRAVLVDPARAEGTLAGTDTVVELAANLDDLNPELCEHVAERLFAAGALDVWWQPIVMKKGRPALALGVLAPLERQDALAAVIFAETTTIGVRLAVRARRVLARRIETVTTPFGDVRLKVATDGGGAGARVMNAAPEHDDCRRLARERGVPLKDVYAAALAAWASRKATGEGA